MVLKVVATIEDLLSPVVSAMGLELWGVEYIAQGKTSLLRVYIDSDKGITVDDCAQVSHQVEGILAVKQPLATGYTLEVSSPGVERYLFKLDQYKAFIGEEIKLWLLRPQQQRRRLQGCLKEVQADQLLFDIEGDHWQIPFSNVDKAHLVCRWV